jgi:hypothetical protein
MSLDQKLKDINESIIAIERNGSLEELSKALLERRRFK